MGGHAWGAEFGPTSHSLSYMNAPTRPTGAATKRSRARTRTSVTDLMETAAEQLWSGKTRGLLEFEWIAPTNGLPMGAIGVAAGPKGDAAFYSYLKQPKVIARLEAEGFERAGQGAPHPWYLRLGPGVVAPGEKALCRNLTCEQRVRIDANRIVALERRRQRICDAGVEPRALEAA